MTLNPKNSPKPLYIDHEAHYVGKGHIYVCAASMVLTMGYIFISFTNRITDWFEARVETCFVRIFASVASKQKQFRKNLLKKQQILILI